MARTLVVLLAMIPALIGCDVSQREALAVEFASEGALFETQHCLCEGSQFDAALEVYETWWSPAECRAANDVSIGEILERLGAQRLGIVHRWSTGLGFARQSIFLEADASGPVFFENLVCNPGSRGCPRSTRDTVTISSADSREGIGVRACPGEEPVFRTFETLFLTGSKKKGGVFGSELPYPGARLDPMMGCDGATHPRAYLGDSVCDPYFDCPELSRDEGDCEP